VKVELRTEPFDPYREISAYQQQSGQSGRCGATACFIGTMRDFNEEQHVRGMTLEYYPGMTEKHIHRICKQACEKWKLLDCLVLHRTGRVEIGEAIVAIAVWASHRGDSLEACRYIIEDLKSMAPFWKKEELDSGERWVEKNTSGYAE